MVKAISLIVCTIFIKALAILTLSLNQFTSKNILFAVFIFMMFLPEMGFIINKGFRQWLKDGIEDSDGQFNSSDLANLLRHYSTLWCARLYVLLGLLEAFYHIQVREIFVMGSLAGAFGIEAITFLTNRSPKKLDHGK
jgi:hypothetical protein